jgi:SNF family Na+-dependent transporter
MMLLTVALSSAISTLACVSDITQKKILERRQARNTLIAVAFLSTNFAPTPI